MRRLIAAAVMAGVVAVAACAPAVPKYEAWRVRNVRYEYHSACLNGSLGFFDVTHDVVCISRPAIGKTIEAIMRAGRPDVAYLVEAYVLNHEAAHELDFAFGQVVATTMCAPYGAACPFTVRSMGWERGAECILQLVRPDLDIVRAKWFANDAYWLCPANWRNAYLPRLRYAGVL